MHYLKIAITVLALVASCILACNVRVENTLAWFNRSQHGNITLVLKQRDDVLEHARFDFLVMQKADYIYFVKNETSLHFPIKYATHPIHIQYLQTTKVMTAAYFRVFTVHFIWNNGVAWIASSDYRIDYSKSVYQSQVNIIEDRCSQATSGMEAETRFEMATTSMAPAEDCCPPSLRIHLLSYMHVWDK